MSVAFCHEVAFLLDVFGETELQWVVAEELLLWKVLLLTLFPLRCMLLCWCPIFPTGGIQLNSLACKPRTHIFANLLRGLEGDAKIVFASINNPDSKSDTKTISLSCFES